MEATGGGGSDGDEGGGDVEACASSTGFKQCRTMLYFEVGKIKLQYTLE